MPSHFSLKRSILYSLSLRSSYVFSSTSYSPGSTSTRALIVVNRSLCPLTNCMKFSIKAAMELYILSSCFNLSRSSAAAMAGTPKSTVDPTDSTIPLTSPTKPDIGRSNHWGDENTNYRHPTQRFGVSLRRQHPSSLPGSCCLGPNA